MLHRAGKASIRRRPVNSALGVMNYDTGEPVRIGDLVRIEYGRTDGQVTNVIKTKEDMRNWNVELPGVMIQSAPFGLVFWPEDHSDRVLFVKRQNEP